MKRTNQFDDQARQGDVMFVRIDKLPEGAKLQKEASSYVVAHSESGHDHIARGKGNRYHTTDGNDRLSFLEARGPTEVEHMKDGPDAHDTVTLLADIERTLKENEDMVSYWKVINQREMSPQGWQRAQD